MYFSGSVAAPKTKKRWGLVRILVIVFIILPLVFVAVVTLALFIWSSQNTPACACSLPPSVQMTDGYHTLVAADEAAVIQQNNPDATTSIAGIQARLAAHQNFDGLVTSLVFSASAQADQQKVLDTDNALELVIAQEAANRSNVANYNAVLATEQPLDDAFAAAVKQLGND
jgi:flagellar basal body-associated protein FliL